MEYFAHTSCRGGGGDWEAEEDTQHRLIKFALHRHSLPGMDGWRRDGSTFYGPIDGIRM